MKDNNYNFMRLWSWETPAGSSSRTETWYLDPVPFERASSSSGLAADGKPKFDLTKLNQDYFDRLRERVIEAGQDGIYVSVMLFVGIHGWSPGHTNLGGTNPWKYHPFNKTNNINNVDGDPFNTGTGDTTHTTNAPAGVKDAQKAYVKKVIDTVGDLDNVLYEIANEVNTSSPQWQYDMIDYIDEYQNSKGQDNPIGMTHPYKATSNTAVFNSKADWVSPGEAGGYKDNPPANNGSKVILNDTDHIWGGGGNIEWVWKSFTRGLNPIFMDDLDDTGINPPVDHYPNHDSSTYAPAVRKGMTQVAEYGEKIDLDSAKPSGSLTSTGYMLADPGDQYLVFAPTGGTFTVNLSAGAGEAFSVEWLNVNTGAKVTSATISGGSTAHSFTAPFSGPAALLLDDIRRDPYRSSFD
jgi:hypothetical protein